MIIRLGLPQKSCDMILKNLLDLFFMSHDHFSCQVMSTCFHVTSSFLMSRLGHVFQTWKMFDVTSNTVHVLLSFFPCVEEILSCDMIKCIMTYWMFDVHMKHFSCVHTNILMCWYLFYFSIKNNSLRSDNAMSLIVPSFVICNKLCSSTYKFSCY